MFCRIASFFLFSFYNKLHFLRAGGDLMENKEVRKVITFDTIQKLFYANPTFLNTVFTKITGIEIEKLERKLLDFSVEDNNYEELRKKIENMIIFSVSDHSTISETIVNNGTLWCWFYEKSDLVSENLKRFNFCFGHVDSFCSKEFVTKNERLVESGGISQEYMINLDYLYDCDEEVITNPNTLEYLLYPFICFDLDKLKSIYKNDEQMARVIATLFVLKEEACTIKYNQINVSV